ncbi:prephenate dehydratase domain-containing protein, partial [Psychromonas aquatilis]
QCSEFINAIEGVKVHNSQSNMESLILYEEKVESAGAIIPHHALSKVQNATIINNDVTNYANTQTRFLVISETPLDRVAVKEYKTTLVVNNKQSC